MKELEPLMMLEGRWTGRAVVLTAPFRPKWTWRYAADGSSCAKRS